jgi:uncharacterized membrane protein
VADRAEVWAARRPFPHPDYQQVVVTKIMPMNNATGISEAERLLIKQWFESGAKTD